MILGYIGGKKNNISRGNRLGQDGNLCIEGGEY